MRCAHCQRDTSLLATRCSFCQHDNSQRRWWLLAGAVLIPGLIMVGLSYRFASFGIFLAALGLLVVAAAILAVFKPRQQKTKERLPPMIKIGRRDAPMNF